MTMRAPRLTRREVNGAIVGMGWTAVAPVTITAPRLSVKSTRWPVRSYHTVSESAPIPEIPFSFPT
jgi:hypothetical protein